MELLAINICKCLAQDGSQLGGMKISDIVTAAISIATLFLNILFYIIIAPRISFRFQRKDDLLKISSDFFTYLSEVNSFDNFDGVPTKIKSYCVSIDLLFKTGNAPEPLHSCMETVFQDVVRRKQLKSNEEIDDWNIDFKDHTHDLRVSLAKYTGYFSSHVKTQ